MICWFEAGSRTRSALSSKGCAIYSGFLPGSACPHYDSEDRRRGVYRQLVDAGFPSGYAADDGAALHFVGTELHEAVSIREGAQAYRVEPGSESPLEGRLVHEGPSTPPNRRPPRAPMNAGRAT